MKRLPTVFWLILLGAMTVHAGEYYFEAYFCEVGEQSVQDQRWTISTNLLGAITTYVDSETAALFIDFHAGEVVAFPVLRLRHGDPQAVDQQKPVRYAITFDEDGEPLTYEEAGVGLRVEAELIGEETNRLEIKFLVEQRWLADWRPFTTRDGAEVRVPAFGARSWNATLPFSPHQWLWVSGLTRTAEGERMYQITLIRVRPADDGAD